jgi:prepilin-type N-terminal cleavage/methylation domain-containing protein
MRKRKGFTLVEVIVAMAIIGIVAIGFLPALTNNLAFLKQTREITRDSFLAQEDIEIEIENIKQGIDAGTESLSTMTLFSADNGGVTVSYVPISNVFNGVDYYTLVSDSRLPELEELQIFNVNADLRRDVLEIYNAYPLAENNVEGTYENDPVTIHDWMVNVYQWYVSVPGFNIPVPEGNDSTFHYQEQVAEEDFGTKYPVFPYDFILLADETGDTLGDLSQYAGRHLVFVVTPAAKSGKLGVRTWSDPVFVSGLTDTDHLIMHLDASYIDPYNTAMVYDETQVLRWYDLSSIFGNAYPDQYGAPTSSTRRPTLYDMPVGSTFNARYVQFSSASDIQITGQGTNGSHLYVYAVVRGLPGTTIFTNGSTTFTIPDATTGSIGDNWQILVTDYDSDSDAFLFGSDDIEISECVIYDSLPNDVAVNDYFDQKYKQESETLEVSSLYDMNVSVDVGSSYTPPTSVLGQMVTGVDRYVPVTWDNGGSAIDTSSAGTVTLIGTAISDPTKTMTLTVTIVPVVTGVSVSPASADLEIDQTVQLTATVEPADALNQNVIWASSDTAVATVTDAGLVTAVGRGTATITVTTEQGGYVAACTISVTSFDILPGGIILHLDASLADTVQRNTGRYVTVWEDVSGNGNNFIQDAGDANRPRFAFNVQNGFSSISYDGNDFLKGLRHQVLQDAGNDDGGDVDLFADSDHFSVFIATQATTTADSAFIAKAGNASNISPFIIGMRSNNKLRTFLRGNASQNNFSAPNAFHIHSVIWNGTSFTNWLDGTTSWLPGVGTAGNQNVDITLGATSGGGGYFLNGQIAEVLVFSRNLSDSDRQTVENYLKEKWMTPSTALWTFDASTDGWNVLNNLTNESIDSNGLYEMTVSGEDACLNSPNVNFLAADASKVVIRMKNDTTATTAKITYRTGAASWSDSNAVTFAIKPNSDFIEYTVNMSGAPGWIDRVEQIRLYPAIGTDLTEISSGNYGTVTLDYVRVLE